MKDFDKEFLEDWIEHDMNPFIVFDKEGKVIYLNVEAQYLLAEVSTKEIFSLCQTYASQTYGFKTIGLDLIYGPFQFFAVTVGYKSEEFIGIKLYKIPKKNLTPVIKEGESVNIYILLDLCMNASLVESEAEIKTEFDPTFPELRLKIDDFANILNKIYKIYSKSKMIKTKLYLQTGEYIKYENKKFPIFIIEVEGDKYDKDEILSLQMKKSDDINLNIFLKNDKTVIKAPFVKA